MLFCHDSPCKLIRCYIMGRYEIGSPELDQRPEVEKLAHLFTKEAKRTANGHSNKVVSSIRLVKIEITQSGGKVKVIVLQLWLTLCDPWTSLPGSSVHGILRERILEWVAIPFCRASSQSRDQSLVSSIAGRFFTIWVTRETPLRVGHGLIQTSADCRPDWKPKCKLYLKNKFCFGYCINWWSLYFELYTVFV